MAQKLKILVEKFEHKTGKSYMSQGNNLLHKHDMHCFYTIRRNAELTFSTDDISKNATSAAS